MQGGIHSVWMTVWYAEWYSFSVDDCLVCMVVFIQCGLLSGMQGGIHSVWMTVWYAGWNSFSVDDSGMQGGIHSVCITLWYAGWYSFSVDDCLVCRVVFIPSCLPDSHPYRITSTKCRIYTVVSPDDGYIVARNM